MEFQNLKKLTDDIFSKGWRCRLGKTSHLPWNRLRLEAAETMDRYATKTKFDWTLNRPFGSFGTTEEQYVNYVRTDELLSEQFDRHESRVQ